MSGEKYYSNDDLDSGVTLEQLGNLPGDEQAAYVEYWWNRNFEDPANETPYSSEEGGYIYVWGGPYDALSELEQEFSDALPFESIQILAREIERDGTIEWAPGPDHPDHKRAQEEFENEQPHDPIEALSEIQLIIKSGREPRFGDVYEIERRADLGDRIAALEEALAQITPQHGMIGHNNPPPEFSEDDDLLIDQARQAASEIRDAVKSESPDAMAVALSATRLAKFMAWLNKKADTAADEAAKIVGKGAGLAALAGVAWTAHTVAALANDAVQAAISWLTYVALPF